ncbi:MAG: extensin family protein [Paracoccaceae bacterium]
MRGAKLSEHSFGHAIDVSGVTLKDGTTLTVLDHWRSGKYGSVIKAMHSSACGTFGTVLGPNADRYHQNHLHLDTALPLRKLLPLGGDQVGYPARVSWPGRRAGRAVVPVRVRGGAPLAPKRPPVHRCRRLPCGRGGLRMAASPREVPIHARLAPGGPAGFRKRNHSVSL